MLELCDEKFSKGQKMWGYIIGTLCKLMNEKYVEQLDAWKVSNLKIITWINNSIDNLIDIQLTKYETIKEIQEHLERWHTQSNFAFPLFIYSI